MHTAHPTDPADRLALLDLDGVLCDDRHRVAHALARDWVAYFGAMDRDTVWPRGRELYENCAFAGFAVGYCTGRREDTRQVTRKWLKKHGFAHKLPLHMRALDDRRPLAEVKAEVVAKTLADGWREVWLFDDDPHVIDLVAQVPGAVARRCTWYIKPERMVRRGLS